VNLRGAAVLITGGRRVGGDLAARPAERGASVALTYHTSRDAIERTVADVLARGSRALAIPADLARAEEADRAVARAADVFGRLDALVSATGACFRVDGGRFLGVDP
jgi:NAD(P)-dependent dehydrogenase (short-subunit alcohol dehydrogenase family)